jgi:hypothetical protein
MQDTVKKKRCSLAHCLGGSKSKIRCHIDLVSGEGNRWLAAFCGVRGVFTLPNRKLQREREREREREVPQFLPRACPP